MGGERKGPLLHAFCSVQPLKKSPLALGRFLSVCKGCWRLPAPDLDENTALNNSLDIRECTPMLIKQQSDLALNKKLIFANDIYNVRLTSN